jgi:hypothetical protein
MIYIYENAPEPSKNIVLQEDGYKVPIWPTIRHEPRPVVVAEPSYADIDGAVDADDQDSDDNSTSDDTIYPITPSRSSTPRPHHFQAPTGPQPFLDIPIYDFNSGKYITTLKIGQERVSCENISPSVVVDVRTFYAATSNDDGPNRILLPLCDSPIVWECAIVHADKYVQVSSYWDRKPGSNFSFPWYWKSLEFRLQAELDIDGYRVFLKRGLPRSYYGFHIDPNDVPPGMPGPMASSPKRLPVLPLPQSESSSRRALGLSLKQPLSSIVTRVVSV